MVNKSFLRILSHLVGELALPATDDQLREFDRLWDVTIGVSLPRASSGTGSQPGKHAGRLANFLIQFIQDNNISSMVEVSSGHWRSGWQSHVDWPAIFYHGIDMNHSVILDNKDLLMNRADKFGFAEADFYRADMVKDNLPSADLLFTKDTLIHLSNEDIQKFFSRQVYNGSPPKYKYVLCVHDGLLEGEREARDIRTGQWHRMTLSAPPFNLSTKEVFRYKGAPQAAGPKIVELLTL